ncbi:DUF4921 family protein [Candidatus Woesearchaeota archaeon]|nr:DUF4921 family protein [Candidatus Woesearchaeota archaeon]
MGDVRRDYILDRWVVVAPKRGARPQEFKKPVEIIEEKCFFCKGNESLTPPEIGRIGTPWQVRWFQNKFAAFAPEGMPTPRTDNRFYTWAANYGHHEVIVETPDHTRQLAELSEKEIALVLQAYNDRIEALSKRPNIAYVTVFKNSGPDAGTSIVHSHSQVMASALPNRDILEKVAAVRRFVHCPYCAIIESEKKSDRRCFENEDFVAFAPYASRFNYECWIFPKKHIRTLAEANQASLAALLKQALGKVHKLQCSYNLVVHYSPTGEDLHFHIEVLPRISVWGGFENSSNVIINTVAPEDAAAYYRS